MATHGKQGSVKPDTCVWTGANMLIWTNWYATNILIGILKKIALLVVSKIDQRKAAAAVNNDRFGFISPYVWL